MALEASQPVATKRPNWQKFLSGNTQAYLALIYLAIYGYQVIASPKDPVNTYLDVASFSINAVFLLDFSIRFVKSSSKGKFVIRNFIELVSIALPFVRVLRIFRILAALSAIKKHLGSRQARAGLSLSISLPLVTFIASLAILDAERGAPGATITNFPIALWWSIATMATVGDGDLSPVTWEGRIVASALMILGIGLFGAVAALFAATFINKPNEKQDLAVD